MKKLFLASGTAFLFFLFWTASPTEAAFECPEGWYWSRETVACEQETCPVNSHRSYTLECICDDETAIEEFGPTGLMTGCSKKSTNTSSAPPTETTGDAVDQSAPTVVPELRATPPDYTEYLTYVPTELQDPFTELMERYKEEIPRGVFGYDETMLTRTLFTPGQLNNMTYGANDTACGGYQDQVLKWLLSIYFSSDPAVKKLLDGFDFGPVQIEKGAHQAVVLFPKGSDWRVTGIVLDPWVEQRPRIYSIREWDDMFFFSPEGSTGNIFTPITTNTGKFPTTPNADGTYAYDDVYSSKPRTTNRLRLSKGQQIAVQSPVAVLIQSSDGKKIGLTDQAAFVNDFGIDVEASVLKLSDGTYSSVFNLPDGSYTATLTATGSGDVHVYAGTGNDDSRVYNAVRVAKGDALKLAWNDPEGTPSLTDQNDSTVSAQPFNPGEAKDFIEKLLSQYLPYLLGALGLVILLVVISLLQRRRRVAQ